MDAILMPLIAFIIAGIGFLWIRGQVGTPASATVVPPATNTGTTVLTAQQLQALNHSQSGCNTITAGAPESCCGTVVSGVKQIPDGSLIRALPVATQSASDNNSVYWFKAGVRHHIVSGTIAASYFGAAWVTLIRMYPLATIQAYRLGTPLSSVKKKLITAPKCGCVIAARHGIKIGGLNASLGTGFKKALPISGSVKPPPLGCCQGHQWTACEIGGGGPSGGGNPGQGWCGLDNA